MSMKALWSSVLVLLAFECASLASGFKLPDASDLFYDRFVEQRNVRSAAHRLPAHLPYPANRQDGLYEDLDDSVAYQKALAALAEAAENSNSNSNSYDYQLNSSEINSEEILDPNEMRYEDAEIKADPRDEETESHSSLGAGHQYVSGGAGEGKQHLQPDGSVPNKEEVKSDEDLPAYCDPPNPCPVGYVGEDCDSSRPFADYTADFSKYYQESQNCMCDDDHNDCKRAHHSKSNDRMTDLIHNAQMSKSNDMFSAVVAKKSPRIRRDVKSMRKPNPYLQGEAIKIHVAKKSVGS